MRTSKRFLAALMAVAMVAAACGDDDDTAAGGGGTDAGDGAQTLEVLVEPSTAEFSEEYSTSWLHFFPDTVQVRPGDTIDFVQEAATNIHTVASGTLIQGVIDAFRASGDPEGPPPPGAEKIPFVFGEESADLNQGAAQPCFLATGDPTIAEPCEEQDQPDTFTGDQSFFNSGMLFEEETFSVTFDEAIAEGTYTFVCLVHGPEMTLDVEVVPEGTDVPAPDAVAQAVETELAGFMEDLQPAADEVRSSTSPDAQAGVFAEGEVPSEGANVFPEEIEIAAGDEVTWTVNGFHSISFNPTEDARPIMVQDADGTWSLNAKALTPANSPDLPPPPEEPPSEGGEPPAEGEEGGGPEEEGPPPQLPISAMFAPGEFVNSGIVADFRQLVYTLTFDEPGTYEYLCLVHPDMEGTIKVT